LNIKIISIFASLFLFACTEKNDTLKLSLAHTLDTRHSVHIAMEYMNERLQYYSNGTMEIDIYPGGQLGSERELVELLQIGSLSMTKVSAASLEGFVPEIKVFSLPYLIRDKDHFWRVLNSELGQSLLEKADKARLRGLGYYDAGSRSFYSSFGPINSPDDLNGKKIRVLNSPTSMATVNALGGAATPIAWGELYAALQQGVVDGAENTPPSYYLSRHYEIAPYYSLDEHTFIPDVLLCSLPVWNSLTQEQQGWLKQAMADSIERQRTLWQASTKEALEKVKSEGVEVIYPDKSAFQQQVESFHKSFDGTVIAEQIKTIKQL